MQWPKVWNTNSSFAVTFLFPCPEDFWFAALKAMLASISLPESRTVHPHNPTTLFLQL